MSEKGLNLLEHSCWDLGFLDWQPVDFSDYESSEDQEGTWAVKLPRAGQPRGLEAVCGIFGLVFIAGGLALDEVTGNISTDW